MFLIKKGNKTVKNLEPYCLNTLVPKKELAFTLAEVLITIGIIGIVAAMTIPTILIKQHVWILGIMAGVVLIM